MSTFNTDLQSDLSIARLGKPNGFASLGPDGKLLPSQYRADAIPVDIPNLAAGNVAEALTQLSTAGYQTEAQVDSAIAEVVGAAPAALDTLQEIAAALADDDNAIAALVAQDTAHSTAITALQTSLADADNDTYIDFEIDATDNDQIDFYTGGLKAATLGAQAFNITTNNTGVLSFGSSIALKATPGDSNALAINFNTYDAFTFYEGDLYFGGYENITQQPGYEIDANTTNFALTLEDLNGFFIPGARAVPRLIKIKAEQATYDNSISQLTATNVQEAIDLLSNLSSSQRIKLTADTTYYVDLSTGADTNSGLTAQTAFASISKALAVLEKDLDLNGFSVVIAIASGDYSSEGILHLPTLANPDPDTCAVEAAPLNSPVILRGDAFSYPIVEGIDLDHSAHYGLESLSIKDRLRAIRNGVIDISNAIFSTPTENSIEAIDGGIINAIGSYSFNGTYGGTNHVFYVDGGTISVLPINGSSLTLSFEQSFSTLGTTFYVKNNGVLDLKNNVVITNSYQNVLNFSVENAYGYCSSPLVNHLIFGDWGNYNGIFYGQNQLHESIQRITVSADFSFDDYPAKFVHAVVTANCVGSLPTDPLVGRHLVIKNSPTSAASITVNSVAIAPGEIYDIKWDGVEWTEW